MDSGSIETFVSDRLVRALGLTTEQCPLSTYKAADEGQLQCSQRVPSLQWWIQGQTFKSNAKVLNLRCYAMILGEDWLEAISPVWVDYKSKAMRITHLRKRVALQGVKDQLDSCPPISRKKLQGLIKHGEVACCLQLINTEASTKVSDKLQAYSTYVPFRMRLQKRFSLQFRN